MLVEYDAFQGRIGCEVVGIDVVGCGVIAGEARAAFLDDGAIAGKVEGAAEEQLDPAGVRGFVIVIPVDELTGGIECKKAGLRGQHVIVISGAACLEYAVSPEGQDGVDGNNEGGKPMGRCIVAERAGVSRADDVFALDLELADGIAGEGKVG